MGSKEPSVFQLSSSSIALLQERFKKLERVRELRQQAELQRLLQRAAGDQGSMWPQPTADFRGATPRRFHAANGSGSSSPGRRSCVDGAHENCGSETDVDTSLHL